MAISGTYAAGDAVAYTAAKVGIDIGATATYTAIETWTLEVSITYGTRNSLRQISHGGISETATGNRAEDTMVVTAYYDEGANTVPYYNILTAFQSADQTCNMKVSKNSLTSPTTGDFTHTLTSGKITAVTAPPMAASEDAIIPSFSFTVVGNIALAVA